MFLKNSIFIFISTYIVIITTKIIFVFYQIESFNNYTIWQLLYAAIWGIQFDFAVSAIITVLSTLTDFSKKSMLIVSFLLLTVIFFMQISDIMYFYESNRHISYEITDAINDLKPLLLTIWGYHFKLIIGSIFLFAIFAFFFLNIAQKWLCKININKYYFFKKMVLIAVAIFFIRGMFIHIPLNPWQSNKIGDTQLASIALNGSYNIIYASVNSDKKLKSISLTTIDESDINRSLAYIYPRDKKLSYKNDIKAKKRNIIFFFLESWSAVNMKSYGYLKQTTPFFDSILKKSIRPIAMIANGHRSAEGIFATLVSFQNPLAKSVAKTNLQDFQYKSIINILNKKGYTSAFFQGTSKETSGLGSFVQSLGFNKSYGKRDIENPKLGYNSWGVFDQDLYKFTLLKLSSMKQPFVIGINGATTHDILLPKGVKYKKFTQNSFYNKILNTLNYADKALAGFVKKIQKKYPNTLFIFLADHTAGVKGNAFDNFLIPFAIYAKDLKAKFRDVYISQRDITPTVLDLTFGNYRQFLPGFSGKSLISDGRFFADYFHNGILGWIENKELIEYNLANSSKECFKLNKFKTRKISCTNFHEKMKQRAMSFTTVSQRLLFLGKTKQFRSH